MSSIATLLSGGLLGRGLLSGVHTQGDPMLCALVVLEARPQRGNYYDTLPHLYLKGVATPSYLDGAPLVRR